MAHKILIIDDDYDLVEPLRIMLEANGYIVSTAADGDEGKKRIAESKPDLIILDVMMRTDAEGFELAYEFGANPETKDIPIIMQTSIAHWQNYLEASFQAISDQPWPVKRFMEKPFVKDKLLAAIRDLLK